MFSITVGSCRVFSLAKILIMAAINAVAIAETGPIAGSPRDSPQSPLPTLPATVAEAFTSQIRQQP